MKRHAIFVSNGKPCYMQEQFLKEAKKRNVVLHNYWEYCGDADFTLNREYYDKHIREQKGVQINRMVDGIFWRDKRRQLDILNTICPKPDYVIGNGFDYQYLVNRLGIPFIAKESISSLGKGVFLIRSKADYDNAKHCDIFEEVIWDSYGKDVRVYCIGGKVVRCMLRQNEGDFRSNFHQGGVGIIYDINSDILSIADEIYRQTNLDVMGIDLMLNKKGYVFCELNTNPGFEEIDRVHSCNTAGDILDLCLSKI